MTRLKRIWPADMPKIRDELHSGFVRYAAHTETRGKSPDHSQQEASVIAQVREGQLWWVAEGMCELAQHASKDAPEWDPREILPSPAGIVVYAASTGLEAPWEGDGPPKLNAFKQPVYPTARVRGFLWTTNVTTGKITCSPLTDSPDVLTATEMKTLALFIVPNDPAVNPEKVAASMLNMLCTTWVLAMQPGLGVQRAWSARRDPGRQPPKPRAHESALRIITLRETPFNPDAPAPENGATGTGTPLDHRVLVRGHWRNVPCGPNRDSRRPTFIAPFIRGPEGAPLRKPAETVFLWKR